MTDTRHQSIPEQIRDARRRTLLAALADASEASVERMRTSVRTGHYLLRLVDFPERGQELIVAPLVLGQGEIRVGVLGAQDFERAWMYKDLGDALAAAAQWFLDREHRPEPEVLQLLTQLQPIIDTSRHSHVDNEALAA